MPLEHFKRFLTSLCTLCPLCYTLHQLDLYVAAPLAFGAHHKCPRQDSSAHHMGRHPSVTLSLHPASLTQVTLTLPCTDDNLSGRF